MTKEALNIYLSKQFDNNNNNVAAFWRQNGLVGPFFIDSSLDQTKYHIIYYQTK
jgi:hypothetical protein